MTIKPFAIQGADLTLGGVNLQAGTTGVVIPGVTQAASYRVEEVEDTGDQTFSNFPLESEVVVIDAALYNTIVADGNVSVFADFTATTDGEGYIDEIQINGRGTYTQQLADTASGNDMYAYIGTGSASDRPLVPQDWIQIPFRPKMRVGEVETIGGGGSTGDLSIEANLITVNDNSTFINMKGGDNNDLYIGTNADKKVIISVNENNGIKNWEFRTDGSIYFPDGTTQTTAATGNTLAPQLTKVDNKIQLKGTLEMGTNPGGSVSTLDSDENTYIWFNSATGDTNGNKYAIGSDDYGANFLISYNPDGSLRWKFTFNDVEYDGGTYSVYPYTIKQAVTEGEYIYVGFDVYNVTGAIAFDTTGTILTSWVWTVDGASSLDHYALDVDPNTGNPILAGRAYGEWVNFDSVPVISELIEDGVLSINRVSDLNNITNVYPSDTSKWNIDIDGTSNWYQPTKINAFTSVPLTTVTGVGGYRSLTSGASSVFAYNDGALTVDNSGATPILTITAANWRATADLNAILAHGIGQNYSLTLNVSDGYTFQTTHSWTETDPGVSGVWTVEGTLTPISGPPISTAVNVTNTSYGTSTLVDVYYRINDDGTSSYDYVNTNTIGTGYVQGDQVKIPGSLLGGVDLTSITVSSWISEGGPFSLSLIYDKSTHPDLGTTIQPGWLASGGGLDNAVVTSITENDYNGTTPSWYINLAVASSSYDGSSDITYNNAGNDIFMTYYYDWNYVQVTGGRPIQNTVRFLMAQPLTGTNFNLRQSTGDQAFIVTPNWTTTIGDSTDQEFNSISLDTANGILYAIGDFNNPGENDETLIAFDFQDGSIIWQKNFDDGSGWVGNSSVVADGANNCVYVPFENDNGQACVMKLDTDGNLEWAVKLQNNNWDYEPQGAVDSNGDLILVGTYNIYNPTLDSWANELFFTKLSKTDGTQLWANSITRNIPQRNDIYFSYDVDNNWVNIVNDIVYVGGNTYDANNNYNVGIAVAVAADGSGTGDYEGWTYHAFDSLGINTITNDMTFNTTTYDQIDQLAISTTSLNFTLNSDQPGWSTYSVAVGGGSKVKFEDGSEQTTAGIARFAKDGGGTERGLSADMNGKFLFYDNSNNTNNSWIYIPSNADVALPIGYTVTVAIGNLNGYSIYVNNDGNNDVVIYHAGSSDGVNNYWTFGNDGYPGVYTIMKVDTNTWMLAGPDVQID